MTELLLGGIDARTVGPYGTVGDLSWTTRWGQSACGMFEASWSMPLPPDFEHPLLRRGTLVELMDGPYRVGSPLVLAEPGRGSGFDQPWTLTATGVGREVEGSSAFYALDGGGALTNVASTAVDAAIARGLPWAGRDASVPTGPFGPTDGLQSIGSFLGVLGDFLNKRWGVGNDNVVRFMSDPVAPSYQIVPGVSSLGTADDDYASTVLVRYLDSGTSALQTKTATNAGADARFGHREFPVDVTTMGAIAGSTAQAFADGILAKSKGRLPWTNGLTVTSNDILTMGGVPADLSKVAEDVGTGCMVRLHGVWNDLLSTTGATYSDVLMGEAKYTDGSQVLDLSPLGLAPRDLAAVVESITGMAA